MSEALTRRHLPRLIALAAAIALSSGCTTMAKLGVGPNVADPGTRTTATTLNDWNLAQSIRVDIYKNVAGASDAHIEVVCFYQSVLLVGEVPNTDMRTKIEAIAKSYQDVLAVHDELTLANSRGMLDRLGDDALEHKASLSLLTADGVRSSQTRVVANNGTLYLMGKLTQAETDRAIVRLQALDGVSRIVKIIDTLPYSDAGSNDSSSAQPQYSAPAPATQPAPSGVPPTLPPPESPVVPGASDTTTPIGASAQPLPPT